MNTWTPIELILHRLRVQCNCGHTWDIPGERIFVRVSEDGTASGEGTKPMWQTASSRPGGTASAAENRAANAESAGTVTKRAARAKMKICTPSFHFSTGC